MAKIKKYWIRYNAGADRLEQAVTESRFKPQGFGWTEVDVNKCCDLVASCNQPVQFNCIGESFFLEFYDVVQDIYTDIYSAGGAASFEAQIPRGTYDIFINGLLSNSPLYINGEIVGTADVSGNLELLGYDTTNIRTVSNCDDNGNFEVEFRFTSISSSYTSDELSGLVQQRLYTEDGLTLLAQSVLGGGASQTFTVPFGPIKYCVDVPVAFVKDNLDLFPVFQVGGNFGGAGTTNIFYNPNVAVQVCDAGGTIVSTFYTVSLGDGGGQ